MEIRQPRLRSRSVFRPDWREELRACLWPAARGCIAERLRSCVLTGGQGYVGFLSEREQRTQVLSGLRPEHKGRLPPVERYRWLCPLERAGASGTPSPKP